MIQVIPQTPRGIDFGAVGQAFGAGGVQGFQGQQESQLLDQLLSQARGSGMDTGMLIENILASGLGQDTKKLAIDSLQKQEQLAQQRSQVEAPREEKPGEFEKTQLKELAERKKKLPLTLQDLDRAEELVRGGVNTGPFIGRVTPGFLLASDQQELEGIASRLLTSSFTTLPRITAEFESFKGGQLSLKNSPEVNLRLIQNQKAAANLEQKRLKRFEELKAKGASEVAALNRANQETAEEEERLLQEIRQTKTLAESASRQTREDAVAEAKRRGLIP